MQKYLKKTLHSFVAVPVLAASFALNPLAGVMVQPPIAVAISPDKTGTPSIVITGNQQSDPDSQATTSSLALEAAKVDAYYARYGRPAAGLGLDLVTTARKYGLPDYSLAAILQVESSGFAYTCPNNKWNGFGYNSCNGTKFASADDAMQVVAKTLDAQSDGTSRFYANKSFDAKLRVYNSVNPKYVSNVESVMSQIDNMPTDQQVAIASM